MNVTKIQKVNNLPRTISLETPVGNDKEGGKIATLGDLLPAREKQPEDVLHSLQLRSELDLLLTLALEAGGARRRALAVRPRRRQL